MPPFCVCLHMDRHSSDEPKLPAVFYLITHLVLTCVYLLAWFAISVHLCASVLPLPIMVVLSFQCKKLYAGFFVLKKKQELLEQHGATLAPFHYTYVSRSGFGINFCDKDIRYVIEASRGPLVS